ncbi:solute carrier family 23 protein [Nonomuraea sp. NPDC050643]|uniref:solute carrier family 23 protein n=1 Tax=Nonomuraea sp. NPDC050643 TaxID=3155660 RepID=UPI0034058884
MRDKPNPEMERVGVHIDGFNLYYGLRELGGRRFLWLDLRSMVTRVLRSHQRLEALTYFTATIRNDPPAIARQEVYLAALESVGVQVVPGRDQEQQVRCHACGRTRRTYAEKQSDVALGAAMVSDVATGKVDVVMLVSADSDLCAAVHAIRRIDQERETKTRVVTVFPPRRRSESLRLVSDAWPKDPWVALLTMAATFVFIGVFRGFLGRIGVLLGLVFGFVLSWVWDLVGGRITAPDDSGAVTEHFRVNLEGVAQADWIGLPSLHGPVFEVSAIVLVLPVLPVVIALIAENVGHVKAVGEMTGTDVDGYMGRAVLADGVGTVVATSVGGAATTTYAENIGVMAATRVYSTAAYYIAAVIAILFGLCPKFGALIAATPGGVLGGVTTILYGMIGLLGAKIWIENRVNLSDPVNLVPVGAGIICAIGPVAFPITGTFALSGIALGTIVLLVGYHLLRVTRR